MSSKQDCVDLFKSLQVAVSSALQIPQSDSLDFISLTNSIVQNILQDSSKQLIHSISSLSSQYSIIKKSSNTSNTSSQSSNYATQDSLFDQVTETIDEAMELYNISLDKARGIQDATVLTNNPLTPIDTIQIAVRIPTRKFGTFLDIEKPQIHFHDYPIDNSDTPFVSIYDIDKQTLKNNNDGAHNIQMKSYLQDLFKKNSQENGNGIHPYQNEILSSMQQMCTITFDQKDTIVYNSFDQTPCTYIDTQEELFNVIERISKAKEIAIDLENHSIRSFQGFICLIQISTRKEDFIIDAITLRSSIHRALAPIFTDETTIKILHGADRDIQWLERDFGIYVVNMFDTGQAARVLKLPSASLAYLQLRFCNLKATGKKKFQLSDWRMRPLSKEMFQYAQSDTHYLLYIFDRLRAELSKNPELLTETWIRSAKICRKRHTKIRYDPNMGKYLAAKHALGFDPHQVRILEELCQWRDRIAREEDESLLYVAPLSVLYGIVRAKEKAQTIEGFFKYGFPTRIIPPLVHKYAEEIVNIIKDSLAAKLDDKKINDNQEKNLANTSKINNDDIKNTLDDLEEHHLSDSDSDHSEVNSDEEKVVDDKPSTVSVTSSLPKVVIPDIKSAYMKKSDLFNSDSDDDDESDDEDRQVQQDTEGDKTTSPNITVIERETRRNKPNDIEKTYQQENSQNVPLKGCDLDKSNIENTTERVTESIKLVAAKSSLFDLSDGSDDESGDVITITKADTVAKDEKIAAVNAEVDAEIAKVNADSWNNALTKEVNQVMQTDDVKSDRGIKRGIEDERIESEEQNEVLSIVDAAKQRGLSIGTNNNSKKRKKRKNSDVVNKKEAETINAVKVEPFDYMSILKEDKKKVEEGDEDFDPMRKLKADWKDKGNANGTSKRVGRKVRKRKRGKAKSMSFKPN